MPARRPILILGALCLAAASCAPPPLSDADDTGKGTQGDVEPRVSFVFPQNNMDVNVCPQFMVAVYIDGHELVDPSNNLEAVPGQGHWHMVDSMTGDYAPASTPWVEWEADLGDADERNYTLSAELAGNDHILLSTLGYTEATDRVEFTVAENNCVGGIGNLEEEE